MTWEVIYDVSSPGDLWGKASFGIYWICGAAMLVAIAKVLSKRKQEKESVAFYYITIGFFIIGLSGNVYSFYGILNEYSKAVNSECLVISGPVNKITKGHYVRTLSIWNREFPLHTTYSAVYPGSDSVLGLKEGDYVKLCYIEDATNNHHNVALKVEKKATAFKNDKQ